MTAEIETALARTSAALADQPRALLFAALAKAQGEMRPPAKDREVMVRPRQSGTPYRFSYATLDAVYEATKPALAANGLAVLMSQADQRMTVTIAHASGQSINLTLDMPPLPDRPQEAGSLITYFRRYAYCLALGIVADEDDDANAASGNSVAIVDDRREAALQWLEQQRKLLASFDAEALREWAETPGHQKGLALLREIDPEKARQFAQFYDDQVERSRAHQK